MVRALSPFRQHCPNCHWHGPVIQGHSDAVIVSDLIPPIRATCPRCGAKDLKHEAVSSVAAALSRLFGKAVRRIP